MARKGRAEMEKKSFWQNYKLLIIMIGAMILGCVAGLVFPKTETSAGATVLNPLGDLFLNMMFCVVVPMVFASISGSIANMKSLKRGGKIIGVTILTFVVTGAICAFIMFFLVKLYPPVLEKWTEGSAAFAATAEFVGDADINDHADFATMIVNFFTTSDFTGLLSRRAMLPLIVFSMLFGFSVNLTGGSESVMGKFLNGLTEVMMKFVELITYYAPIAFFAIFANLVATFGSNVIEGYSRSLILFYPLCFVYLFTAFPLYARFGGGKGAAKVMFQHITRPAVTSLGTCSSVATIPTNMKAAEETGISKDVAEMVIPLGATMHMDGSCFSAIMKIGFISMALGLPFDLKSLPLYILVAVLASVGMSGVPGGGYIGEFILCSVFFPAQMELAFPIAVAIGTIIDPPSTMINSSGDYVVSYIVSRFVDGKDWLQKQMKGEA